MKLWYLNKAMEPKKAQPFLGKAKWIQMKHWMSHGCYIAILDHSASRLLSMARGALYMSSILCDSQILGQVANNLHTLTSPNEDWPVTCVSPIQPCRHSHQPTRGSCLERRLQTLPHVRWSFFEWWHSFSTLTWSYQINGKAGKRRIQLRPIHGQIFDEKSSCLWEVMNDWMKQKPFISLIADCRSNQVNNPIFAW